MEDIELRYPIGKFDYDKNDYELNELLGFVLAIQELPGKLAKLCTGITEDQLQKTYRPGGWTVKQIMHHLADSHMNAYIRLKLTLTEDTPVVKPYSEEEWAKGVDYGFNYEAAYMILLGLHQKMSLLMLECMKQPELLFRSYMHPQHNKKFTIAQLIAQYGWHSNHHVAHIALALGK